MIEYRTLNPNVVPQKKRAAKYDPAIEAALTLQSGAAVLLLTPPRIYTSLRRYSHRIRPRERTTSDLTIPEPVKVLVPVSYAKLHNAKGSIKRRIKQLGLDAQLTIETRQRKLLIIKK
jgi:hypothetical protein